MRTTHDRVVVIAEPPRALDLLRLAVIRSDDVVLVSRLLNDQTRRFLDHFAVEWRARSGREEDFDGAIAVLISVGDVSEENRLVRHARARGVPVHVPDRRLVSDFTLLELFEPASARRAG